MKTVLAMLIIVSIGCGSYRSGPPAAASSNKNDSFTPTSSSPASNAAELSAPPSESPQPQTQESELWDPTDDLHVAGKMLERVKQEGVVRIASVRASGERYVFVGEFEETWQFAPTQQPRPKTDLWLVNKNGTELRRLTEAGESYDPEGSPSGNEIAFIKRGSVCVIDIASKDVGTLLYAQEPAGNSVAADYLEHSQPKWSPNGKAIAALAKDGTTAWVIVATKEGNDICTFGRGFERYGWNSESEMVVDYGRFVFDWENMFSDTESADRPASNGSNLGTGKDHGGKQEVSERFLSRLLKKVSAYGVERIADYSFDPSGKRIVFAGEFEGNMAYGSGSRGDLWLVNRDGAGLRRLTENHYSSQPVWSPSGKEIAFVADLDSISVINVKTRKVRSLPGLQAIPPKAGGVTPHDNFAKPYLRPRWSPNGKVIAAEGADLGDGFVTAVDARFGNKILDVLRGSFSWNLEGELVIPALGKFVFDWNSALFNRR